MRYQINGTIMQTVAVDLSPGETVYSQTNTMCWMNDQVQMDTHTGGGLFAGLKRTFGGGSLFITDFTATGNGHVAFAPRFPGTIIPVQLVAGQSLICRKETFLCAEKSVTLEIAWQKKFGAGFFGGDGFILQKVTGPGVVFLDLSGEVVEKDLAPGEKLLVHAGHVGVFDPSIDFDIQMVKGFKNILFGGEGLFLATLTGPGHVALQSMPIVNLAEEIGRFLPTASSAPSIGAGGAAGGVVGGVLGGMFGGSSDDGSSGDSDNS
ncbi:MAG: TIGR00266 family protein [Beijerinckiaceae bacterium]